MSVPRRSFRSLPFFFSSTDRAGTKRARVEPLKIALEGDITPDTVVTAKGVSLTVTELCGVGHFSLAALNNLPIEGKETVLASFMQFAIEAAQRDTEVALGERLGEAHTKSAAFVSNVLALNNTTSHNTSSPSTTTASTKATAAILGVAVVDSVERLFDADTGAAAGDDDADLLAVMNEWWAGLRAGPDESDGSVLKPTRDVAVSVFCDAAEAQAVQPVMAALLQRYHERFWGQTAWLHSEHTRADFAFYAAPARREFDELARASSVMLFDFKASSKAGRQAKQDFSVIARHAGAGLTGTLTPRMFSWSGPPSDFELFELRHDHACKRLSIRRFRVKPTAPDKETLATPSSTWRGAFRSDAEAIELLKPLHAVMKHVVASRSMATAASDAFEDATPLLVESTFRLPAPIETAGAALAAAFQPFAAASLPISYGVCTIEFTSVVAVTHRRLLMKARVGERELVLKYCVTQASAKCELERVERVAAITLSPASRDHVRLPLGYFRKWWPVFVSDAWTDRSLDRGWLRREKRAQVRALLETQIWPVIDELASKGLYYADLHAGNVMVDDALENAWLIDFEGVLEQGEAFGSATLGGVAADPKATVATQKEQLLGMFRD